MVVPKYNVGAKYPMSSHTIGAKYHKPPQNNPYLFHI